MPAIVGPVQIQNVGGGTVQFGDTVFMNPKSASKSFSGSGGGNTGPFIIVNNVFSITNTFDANGIDMPVVGNN
ncbi:spore gernimation protein GerPF [Bacillus coahuilensis m2-6]|uniref:Spore gernimation protein GerPF n=1 Tax=Bacillus coahuilensis p1.1.43 TaxID=1150625 RepID=A0A147KAM7_9BACI|nr:spore germination protein [Bacillus coahuilensis]KUP07743.1 spore gernimation protein GerPF [Bacillus coahuilensis p1.1.43]KUP09037.1 spore gernimation protein GerPF [Bacillus coahuilensis m2-6]